MTKKADTGGFRWFPRGLTRALCWLPLGLLAISCGGSTRSDLGGESHFLGYCAASCGDGLACLSGVCSKSCGEEPSVCASFSPSAVCQESDGTSVCDVPCVDVRQCVIALDGAYRCENGFCRRGNADSGGSGGASGGNSSGGASAGNSSGGAGMTGQGGSGASTGASCRVAHQLYASGSDNVRGRAPCETCRCENGALVDCVVVDDCIGIPVHACPEEIVTDKVEVAHGQIIGSTIRLDLRHGGGCGGSEYALCFEPSFLESNPVQTSLHVIYDGHDDACARGNRPQVTFDLRPLAAHYERSYGTQEGLISTNYGLFGFGDLACEERSRSVQNQLSVAAAGSALDGSCASADDCQTLALDTKCGRVCDVVMPVEAASSYAEVVSSIEDAMCSMLLADCTLTTQDCPEPPAFDCVEGVCKALP